MTAEKLLETYDQKIRILAHRMGANNPQIIEDLIQIGRIKLVEISKRTDIRCKIWTYAENAIRRAMCRANNGDIIPVSDKRKKHKIETEPLTLDVPNFYCPPISPEYESLLREIESDVGKLPPKKRASARAYLSTISGERKPSYGRYKGRIFITPIIEKYRQRWFDLCDANR